ncbi:unnamed protein product [Menidia menidia]|uniref:(Atlantic silverside) hypothetical protein n=1 Tax=Menidia menidia TaxID=238744 RepID=A0A8S4BFE3_9TELE|nr:unnamed protein product [Menidia menidia]
MNVPRGFLAVLSLVCYAESRCSPTSYYKSCWIRRFPGIFVDIEESQRRGAQMLRFYQEESALKCSRTCCLTRNISCNLAVFHYDAIQENVNCIHLNCPTLESCILRQKSNVVLYNITQGVDPDLLVFGKYFTSNVRVLPHHYTRVNASDPLPSDKRQFVHPPPPAAGPLTPPPSVKPSGPVSTAHATPGQRSASAPRTVSSTAWSPAKKTPPSSGRLTQTASTTTTTSAFTPSPLSAASGHHSSEDLPPVPTTTERPFPSISDPHRTATSPQEVKGPLTATTQANLATNHTTGNEGDDGGGGGGGEEPVVELGPGWHVAAHTLMVAVAVCVTVLLSCCCSLLLVVSWRGQKKRMGRYRTSWRRKRGSMRLIKYVLVRENS